MGWDGFRALSLLRCGGLAPFEDLSAFPLAFFIQKKHFGSMTTSR